MKLIICVDCKKDFRPNIRGSKRVPVAICPQCVLRRVVFQCPNCRETGCIKEGFYLATCWDCNLEGCKRCITNEKFVKGIEFDFCDKHKSYDMKQLIEDADELLLEEATYNTRTAEAKQ